MRLLLDTHALLWWLFDSRELPDTAWEIATKHRLGKLPEAGDVVHRLPAYLRRASFEPLPITLEHAREAGGLPGPHKDPVDRMLIAQSRIDALTVVTRDAVFTDYGVPVLW